jgi:hypothetical protein
MQQTRRRHGRRVPSRRDCIAEQQGLNWQYYEQKREQDWPLAKAAHANADQKEIASDETEAGGAEDDATEEASSAIMGRWYDMRGRQSK